MVSITTILLIFRREVDLDSKNIGGWTPLMYAAYIGHDNIANLLLEAGVNVNATTPKGLTPLMLAASCGNESIAYFLFQVRNDQDSRGPHGARCKQIMCSNVFPECKITCSTGRSFISRSMKGHLLFLPQKQGADLELKDSRGWTALFHCTSTGHQQMVKFLLDNNANANVKWVLIFIPKVLEHSNQLEDLITFSFMCREPGSGFTPLMEAAVSGHEIIVQNLLDHVSKSLSKPALHYSKTGRFRYEIGFQWRKG